MAGFKRQEKKSLQYTRALEREESGGLEESWKEDGERNRRIIP